MRKFSKHFILLFSVLSIFSCVSKKDIAYFQDIDNLSDLNSSNNNILIQPDDLLTIRVSAPEQDAAQPFNLTKTVGNLGMSGGSANIELETYMVANDGTIQFPILGKIKASGFTSIELATEIEKKVRDYVKDPLVNVRILNFEVSVLGEVGSPGTLRIEDDHLSLAKALANAGDILITGKRTNVLVVREDETGKRSHAYLDLTKANVIDSPFYNLKQNDVVYVEPGVTQRQRAGSLSTASQYLSIASIAISLIFLFTR